MPNKTKRLDIVLTPQERAAIETMTAREGVKLSEMTRTLLREALEVRGIKTLGLLDLLYKPEVRDAHQSK